MIIQEVKQWDLVKTLEVREAANTLYSKARCSSSYAEFFEWLNETIGRMEIKI